MRYPGLFVGEGVDEVGGGSFLLGGKNKTKSLVAERQTWCEVFISAFNEKPAGTLRAGRQMQSAQRWAGVATAGESAQADGRGERAVG